MVITHLRILKLFSILQRHVVSTQGDEMLLNERRVWARQQYFKKKRQVLGADGFVVKPYTTVKIREMIDKFRDGRKGASPV